MTIKKQFGVDNVTVILEWIHENATSYTLSTIPQVAIRNQTTSVQMTLSYNTLYNVSVVATLCGQNTTIVSVLSYGETI